MSHSASVPRALSPLRYGLSPFEHALGESGGSVQLAVLSGSIRWPRSSPYPEGLHRLVDWMVQRDVRQRPTALAVMQRAEAMLASLPPDG